MLELKDTILQQDMEELASNPMLAEQLKNSTVFITGATGLIGSQVVFALAFMNQKQNTNIRIVAMARDRKSVV